MLEKDESIEQIAERPNRQKKLKERENKKKEKLKKIRLRKSAFNEDMIETNDLKPWRLFWQTFQRKTEENSGKQFWEN